MRRKAKYTITTDAAIERARRAVAQIVADAGTTAGEKMTILRELREFVQQHEVASVLAAGQEASRDA